MQTELTTADARLRESTVGSIPSAWSEFMEPMFDKVAASDVPILLRGETGVGKEVLARKLHALSGRANRAFLKLNCAALPSELIESELFGYERGAFTGAFKNTPGKFELANGGTILLDEIGEMDFKVQAKLLQVLQDREFHRLGSKELCRVDVRIMAATHCDLEAAITEKRFREDLFYRLNIIGITIPPLRQRKTEILPLAECFIKKYGGESHPEEVPPALQEVLLDHFWPGNVRELENLIRKYLVFRSVDLIKEEIRRKDRRRPENRRPLEHRRSSDIVPYKASTSALYEDSFAISSEATTIRTALESFQWNHEQAARSLRMDYGTLLSRMKALAIQRESTSALQGPPAPAQTVPPSSSILMHVDHARMEAEKEAIVAALSSTLWHRKQAATLLGIDYKALLYKMKKLGIGEKASAAAANV